MDTGQGRFEMLNTIDNEELDLLKKKFPNHGGLFIVGEEVKVKGSTFRVKSIKPTELRLKLLKKGNEAAQKEDLTEPRVTHIRPDGIEE